MKKKVWAVFLLLVFLLSGCADAPAAAGEFQDSKLPPAGDIVSLAQMDYSYEEFCRQTEKLEETYALSVFSIGTSVFGREIPCLVLGDIHAEKKLLIIGGLDGTQAWSTRLLMKQLETYCVKKAEMYETVSFGELFESCAVYFVPMVNPDGIELCAGGLASVPSEYKTQVQQIREYSVSVGLLEENAGYEAWQANGAGIDLSINFGIGTVASAQIQKQAASDNYPGEPFSAPEAAALVHLCEEQNFFSAAVYTGPGGLVDWFFGQKDSLALAEYCADELAALTGYRKIANGPAPDVCTAVSFSNWFISRFDRPAFTLLMGEENMQLSLPRLWKQSCLVPPLLAWRARRGDLTQSVQTPTAEYTEIE